MKNEREPSVENFPSDFVPRFSAVQKSIEILRALIPEDIDDQFVDKIYTKVFEKVNEESARSKIEYQ